MNNLEQTIENMLRNPNNRMNGQALLHVINEYRGVGIPSLEIGTLWLDMDKEFGGTLDNEPGLTYAECIRLLCRYCPVARRKVTSLLLRANEQFGILDASPITARKKRYQAKMELQQLEERGQSA